MAVSMERAPRPAEPEAPRVGEKRYFCPACRQASLALAHDAGPYVARCESCAWATDDLLALIPTRPASVAEVALGSGPQAALRAIVFFVACATALALVIAGR